METRAETQVDDGLLDLLGLLRPDELDRLFERVSPVEQKALQRALGVDQGYEAPIDLLPHQRPPEAPWKLWLLEAGRGTGKTQAVCNYLCRFAHQMPGMRARIIAPTYADAVEACIEGPSGVRALDPTVEWAPSAPGGGHLYWPNGSSCLIVGTHAPRDVNRLRAGGNRHLDVWEEMAANPQLEDAWKQAQFGLRLGRRPHSVGATTPAAYPAYVEVRGLADIISHATIDDNPYLPESWVATMKERYGNTHIGRQELYGELLDDVEGALVKRATVDEYRVTPDEVPDLPRVSVAVDPSGTKHRDEQGIIAAGKGTDGHYYVLGDHTLRSTPDGWASAVKRAVETHQADRVVPERNFGGDMVRATLEHAGIDVPIREVTASRGKQLRAQPVALLYERGMVHHVGSYPQLEAQLTTWTPGDPSPDRLDALVFAITDLAGGFSGKPKVHRPTGSIPQGRVRS